MKRQRKPQQPAKPNAAGAPADFHPRVFTAEWFGFYLACGERACRRMKRCTGGANPPCFYTVWPHLPTREKVRFRATVMAKGDENVTVEQAMAAGDAAVARYDEVNGPPAPEDNWERADGVSETALPQSQATDDDADVDTDAPAAARIRSL